jgi:hypothetical protein
VGLENLVMGQHEFFLLALGCENVFQGTLVCSFPGCHAAFPWCVTPGNAQQAGNCVALPFGCYCVFISQLKEFPYLTKE